MTSFAATIIAIGFVVAAGIGGVGTEQHAQLGDFFGGFLNPLLTFVAFLGLLVSILIQQKELKESREEFRKSADALKEQNFISSFYQLLEVHNSLVETMEAIDADGNTVRGRRAFEAIYSQLRKLYREKRKKFPRAGDERAIRYAYAKIYIENPQLSVYYRYLFNTIKIVEGFPDAKKYIKVLRSLLSNRELLLLFYNCTVSPPGEPFNELAIRHKLFDNMPAHLLDSQHAKLIDEKAFGPTNYSSKLGAIRRAIKGDLSQAP